MANIYPFRAVLAGDRADVVSAPPYDVMSTAEAAAMAEGNPLSFLRVSRPELELPDDTDPHSAPVYERAAANYQALKTKAPLLRDADAHFYVYRLTMRDHVQTGVVATPAVADYDNGTIRRHEKTRPDKVEDRTRHILALRAQTGPVFLAHADSQAVSAVVDETVTGAPLFDFRSADGVGHCGWRVDARHTAGLGEAFARIPRLYIADGHHRAASASLACREQQASGAGAGGADRFLAVLFPASQLRILPYNRLVRDLCGKSPDELLGEIRQRFEITHASQASPAAPGTMHMFLAGSWYRLTCRCDVTTRSPVDQLDVSVLQDLLLQPLLGIDDPRTSQRIDFVGGIRGTGELERRVCNGQAAVAFAMYPTSMRQLMAISDADQIMPPKSTWFEPKLRDGLFIHEI